MQIYIFRHGIAETARPGQDDASRRLTPEGKEKLRRILEAARGAGVRPDVILSSHLKRAVETAALAQEILKIATSIMKTESLLPAESPEKVWEEIRQHREAKQVLLAGHEPQFSSLVSYLMGAPNARVEMKKGAMARVDIDSLGPRPAGVLVWLLTAKLAGA
ncbi:MAG: phosphohistidine phosphatase SixA [Acidobacteria bacterium]|nr:phosphohistidine phosphatase SixA [Acidobacteriota bacterium]